MSDRAVIKGHTITKTMHLDAPRAEVWAVVSEPTGIARWFSDAVDLDSSAVGATGTLSWEGYGTFPVAIVANEPSELFAWRWGSQPGTELLDDDSTTATFTLTDDGTYASFAITQTAVADYPTIRPHRMAIGFYSFEGEKLVRDFQVEIDVDGERTEVPQLIGRVKPDLLLINDDDLAYAKIRLDPDSLAVAIEHLRHIEDPLARAIVWGAVWDATRDAETPASDYVRLVLGNIATETESTTIRTTLGQLGTTARVYVAPAKRAATIEHIATELWALARAAEAGSDAQFQFVKFFANIASTPEHAAALRGLRDGDIVLDGLAIDTDLSWELLEGLVLAGAASEADVDAALANDNTSNGQQAAARARATIATPEGKRAAFDSLVTSDDLPNVIVRTVGMGYLHTNDPASLQPLIEPYFAMLNDIWKSRTYKIAEYIVIGLYPASLASQELVDATKAWLASNPEIPALRRLVIENLAGVERALIAQARDRA